MKILFFLLFPFLLFAETIDTFYGPLEVEEPVLLELIHSAPFERLKDIHQYGVSYFTTHREPYTRYAHSLGVFAILRRQNASLETQIAGLLHDVSHTAFSHLGDWLYGKENQERDYQNSIHEVFLEKSGLAAILKQHQIPIAHILPESCPALECPLPNLSADRIDYNIQGAYYQNFITYEEAMRLFEGFQYTQGVWIHPHHELLKKLVRFSLFMTQDCWGSPPNYLSSRWLADAILRAIDLGALSHEEIHFGTDLTIWNKLMCHTDPVIQEKVAMVLETKNYYSFAPPSEADLIIKSRFRGIDPIVFFEEKQARLSSLDPLLAEEYLSAKKRVQQGWAIKLLSPLHY